MPMSQDESKYQSADPRKPDQIESGIIISPDTRRANRIPPGQARTRKWPVLHYSHVPQIPLDKWSLKVFGLVEHPQDWSWSDYQALPRVKVFSDFHCVTRWSRLDNVWEGVSTREIAERAKVRPSARFVVAHGYDGQWTTNLPLADFLSEDALVADLHDGEPIIPDHGGPARLVVPLLYAWKSAKWLRAIEFVGADQPGYWERGGYHNHGDPWKEERYGW
jgi:DMSO/TMAO reductase YedYZ molybdopterin-dependent catalytic subunit